MRTQIFAHKGMIGIVSDYKAEGLVNDPSSQLGFVLKAEFVDVQPAALELLKTIKKSGDDIGDVDIHASDIGPIINWLGGPWKVVRPNRDEKVQVHTIQALLLPILPSLRPKTL
jgi:hypothetical protein